VRARAAANRYSLPVAKKSIAVPEVPPASRQERLVTYIFFAILGMSVLAIVALIIGGPDKSGSIWTTVALIPFLGIPLSFLLLVSLLVLNGVRRGRAAKGAGK
jgi:hypothetical protein